MIVSAAIVSKEGEVFCPSFLPYEVRSFLSKNARNFLFTLSIADDDENELPYTETTYLRYVYKQTDDLYWVLVTKPESDLLSDVKQLGKFVCTIMEYGLPETNSQTITDEQKDLFYRHIWRAWDRNPQCSTCGRLNNQTEVWEREFASRVQFLINTRDGHVEEADINYFNDLIADSWATCAKLSMSCPKSSYFEDSDTDSFCSSDADSISEEIIIDGCRLACRLEDITIEVKRIQDPYLRLFARRDLLVGSEFAQLYHLGSAPMLDELDTSSQ